MIGAAASDDRLPNSLTKGSDDGQGQQLTGQRQEEGQSQGSYQAGAGRKGCQQEKVSFLMLSGVNRHHAFSTVGSEQLPTLFPIILT
jgi:hypothetical protein